MTKKRCPTCKHRTAVRRERPRLLRGPIALLIRYFPWRCTFCGDTFYSKERGTQESLQTHTRT